MMKESSPIESENDGSETDESDRELQIAFQKGYLKPGLNVVQPVIKKKWLNNVTGLKAKLMEFKKEIDWIEHVDVTVPRTCDAENEESASNSIPNDFQREISFLKQAQSAVASVLPKLYKLKVATKRPDDYFAEMVKSDQHMKRVRENLFNLQAKKERSEVARRMREERKFSSKIQKEVALERQKEKKQLMEAVKKHKQGMKDRLEEIVNKSTKKQPNQKGKKRSYKDSKYGYGGPKKRSKSNTADSAADYSQFDSSKFSRPKQKSSRQSGGGKKAKSGKTKRLGKSRRAQNKNRKGGGFKRNRK